MNRRERKRQAQRMDEKETRARSHHRAKPVLAALSLPEDVGEDGVRVILLGSGRALIENMLGIADVGREEIRLAVREGVMVIRGRDLILTDVREGALAVEGRIASVCLPGEFPEAEHD